MLGWMNQWGVKVDGLNGTEYNIANGTKILRQGPNVHTSTPFDPIARCAACHEMISIAFFVHKFLTAQLNIFVRQQIISDYFGVRKETIFSYLLASKKSIKKPKRTAYGVASDHGARNS